LLDSLRVSYALYSEIEAAMKTVNITDEAYERLAFAAKVAGVPLSAAVDRLVGLPGDSRTSTPSASAPTELGDDEIAVHVVYRGKHIAGFLSLETERLRIIDGPQEELIGTYRSPSQAAVQVVRVLNPGRQHPETNGWRFWNADDGQIIDRHRRRRS
jgi:hypothetical protein